MFDRFQDPLEIFFKTYALQNRPAAWTKINLIALKGQSVALNFPAPSQKGAKGGDHDHA
ncbi:hypothetical protein [Afipia massiliensis]|uniref:hypothetical protein n=1 Tax=Afipia massiliensis TaxID=211460 RepID=UPI00160D1300|nr:hypothetical protein [Afipia massiliensis]